MEPSGLFLGDLQLKGSRRRGAPLSATLRLTVAILTAGGFPLSSSPPDAIVAHNGPEATDSDWSRAVVDSCSIRAVYGGDQAGPNPTDRAKHGSKRHVICDGRGVPLAVRLTGANRNDSKEALVLVDAIPPLQRERGRPRRRPDCVLEDRGYDTTAIRRGLRTRHIVPVLAKRRTEHGVAWAVALDRGAHICLTQSVSPPARAV